MVQLLKKLFNSVISVYHQRSETPCRIDKIDLENKMLYIHYHGLSTPIKFKLGQIAADEAVLSNLSPEQASWVGYYCGKLYRKSGGKEKIANPDLPTAAINAQYRLLQQQRTGEITFLDAVTNQSHAEHPSVLLRKKEFISQFCQVDAYYIGFFHGLTVNKNTHYKKFWHTIN